MEMETSNSMGFFNQEDQSKMELGIKEREEQSVGDENKRK